MISASRALVPAILAASLLLASGCGARRDHEAVVKDTIAIVNEQADILSTVHDQATAAAVIDRLLALNRKAMRLKGEMLRMPPPTPEAQQRLAGYQTDIAKAVGRLNAEQARIEREAGKGVLRQIDDSLRRPN